MKKLPIVSAVFAAAIAQPAMANSCNDCAEGSHNAQLTARIVAETAKAEIAMAHAAKIEAGDEHKAAAGWPCDESKNATKVAMRIAAEAITKSAEVKSKVGLQHDCECEDCADGLCTEVNHTKMAANDCGECVDQARFA